MAVLCKAEPAHTLGFKEKFCGTLCLALDASLHPRSRNSSPAVLKRCAVGAIWPQHSQLLKTLSL